MSAEKKKPAVREVSLSVAALRSALMKLRHIPVLKGKKKPPILSGVLMELDESGSLRLSFTDLDHTMHVAMAAHGKPFSAVIMREVLTKIARIAIDEAVLVFEEDQTTVSVRSGVFSATIPTMAAEDFPRMAPFEPETTLVISAAALLPAMARVSHCMSTQENRYYLNGIYFQGTQDRLSLATTDGHRLVEETIDCVVSVLAGTIIPRNTVLALMACKPSGDVILRLNKTAGSFQCGYTTIQFKVIDGMFPDYRMIIPKHDATENWLSIDAAELSRSAKALRAFGGRDSPAIKFDLAKSSMVSVQNRRDNIDASLPLGGDWRGPPTQIGFQSRYVSEMVRGLVGNVVLRIPDGVSPVRFESEELPGWIGVLMPMRV
jgi:DNA polymerase-3 subunit beta